MITDYLVKASNGLIKVVPEYRDEGLGYTAFNSGSVECEVGEFLYGLVRVLKPRMVLETGTYLGGSSSYIAQGLKDNNTGMLETLEIEEQHIGSSKQLWHLLDLQKWITSYKISSSEFEPKCNYELMFLDSEPPIRYGELVRFYNNLTPGGFAIIHDCPRSFCQGNVNPDHPEIKSWPFGPLNPEIKQWVKDRELIPFHLPSPRGCVIFYKSRADDYKFL